MAIVNVKEHLMPLSKAESHDMRIGKILVDSGKITQIDAERIWSLQKIEGLRFGAAAQKLGLITQSDMRQALSQQFDHPYLQANQSGFSKDLVAAYQPFSPQVEALRGLRSQLNARFFNEADKSLAIISPNMGEGCSNLAANLAVVFSQLGERTLLIDANLRDPCQHKIFNLEEQLGLSDILVGRADLDVATKIEPFPYLTVLGAGTIPANPQELLSRYVFTDFMEQVAGFYDVIIVDTAPAVANSDAQTVAARCDGALLVSRLNKTRTSELENVRDQLVVTGVNIVGAVLNDF
ncbi:MAG TPA: chain length determinant protein tyrosine kinase EpsG [Methylotenera sp.]|nr:chain length determinant protein tyrosine kinase EpsG [Methylotenera sp.]